MNERAPQPLDDLLADLLDEQFAEMLAAYGELLSADGTEPISKSPPLPSTADESENGKQSAQWLGRFEILRELGRGGGGIVFLAFDPQLNRQVALKVPHPEVLVQRELRERFLQEARAAAALHHPNIVPVFETGEVGPICYLVSEFCAGPTLAAWLKEREAPVPVWVAAGLVATLADSVEHAHQHGILHRDLKPSNVLLEIVDRTLRECSHHAPRDEASSRGARGLHYNGDALNPKLTDFGLAKVMERESQHTRTNAMVGTPAYMAPEQAEGRNAEVGLATDVYALGVILYELLTGQTPFQDDSHFKLLRAIASPEPPYPPRGFRRDVPCELEAICLKCLEKPANQRYASAAALAEDLRRFLDGRPTMARPEGVIRRAWKWSRRRPALAALAAVFFLAPITAATAIVLHNVRVDGVENTASAKIKARDAAERERTRRYDYATHIQGAYQAWQNNDLTSAMTLLDQCRPRPGEEDLRGWEWYYVRRLCAGGVMTLRGHSGPVRGVAYSPDAKRLASCDAEGVLRLWDAANGESLATVQAHQGGVNGVAFSPDGKLIASVGDDGYVRFWNANRCEEHAELQGSKSKLLCVAFLADGRQVAAAGEETVIRIWDVAKQELVETLHGHTDSIYSLAYTPIGSRLASGSADRTARVWEHRLADEPAGGLTAFGAVSRPDIASRRDAATWGDAATFDCASPASAVAFTPDGQTLATSELELWDLKKRHKWLQMNSHQGPIRSIAFSPDGRTIASGAGDTTVQTRDATLPSPMEPWDDISVMSAVRHQNTFRGHAKDVLCVAYSPNGNHLASGGKDGTIQIWDPAKPQERYPLKVASETADCAVFSPDGVTLAVASSARSSSQVTLWNLRRCEPLTTFTLPENSYAGSMTYSPDGKQMAFAISAEPLLLRDMVNGVNRQFADLRGVGKCAFSPDSRRLAVHTPHGTRILDASTGEVLVSVPGQRSVAFSPDGRLLATESEVVNQFYSVELWDVAGGRSAGRLVGHTGEIDTIAFSADSRLLATGSTDGTARLWDVAERTERWVLRGHRKAIGKVAFLMSQRSLATASYDGTIKIWDVDTGRQLLSLDLMAREGGIILSMAVSPDGRTLATVSKTPDGRRRTEIWSAPADVGD